MAIEKERKFLCSYIPDYYKKQEIKQAYLMIDTADAGRKQLRVRIVDDREAWMTFKSGLSSLNRNEYEYKIPLEDALEMWNQTEIKLIKTRYKTTFEGNAVDIDVYPMGLMTVEIEFINELTNIPHYCGDEITDQLPYSNIYLAMQNIR